MATRIKSVTQKRNRLYPWEEWTDGGARRAKQGKDFKISPKMFAQTVYSYARRNKIPVTVGVHDDSVEFQFFPNGK